MAGVFYAPGIYWGKITSQKLGKSSNNNPQLVVTFTVISRVNPADPDGYPLPIEQEFERMYYKVITDKTMPWVIQDLNAIGWYGTDWNDFDEGSSHFVSILGTELTFRCEHEAHYKTNQLREVWSVGGQGSFVTPLDEAEAKSLNALFGKHLRLRKRPTAVPAVAQPQAAKPNPADYSKPVGQLTPEEATLEVPIPENEIPF